MTIDTTNIIHDFGGVLMKHDRESRLNGLRQLILEHVLEEMQKIDNLVEQLKQS